MRGEKRHNQAAGRPRPAENIAFSDKKHTFSRLKTYHLTTENLRPAARKPAFLYPTCLVLCIYQRIFFTFRPLFPCFQEKRLSAASGFSIHCVSHLPRQRAGCQKPPTKLRTPPRRPPDRRKTDKTIRFGKY